MTLNCKTDIFSQCNNALLGVVVWTVKYAPSCSGVAFVLQQSLHVVQEEFILKKCFKLVDVSIYHVVEYHLPPYKTYERVAQTFSSCLKNYDM